MSRVIRSRALLTPPAPPVLETVNGMSVSAKQLERLADTLRDMYGGSRDWDKTCPVLRDGGGRSPKLRDAWS